MLLTIISFIFVLELIVFFHELGHYWTAKKNDVKVEEFSLGMGPAIFKKQKGETLYALRIFLIGGYVKMEGEDAVEESDDPRSFSNKAPWRRLIILVAGALMNFVLAILLFTGVFLITGIPSTTLAEVVDDSPAYEAGLTAGDQIIAVNSEKVDTWEALTTALQLNQENAMMIEYIDDETGEVVTTQIVPEYNEEINRYVIGIQASLEKSVVGAFTESISTTGDIIKTFFTFIYQLFVPSDMNQIEGELVGPVGVANIIGDSARNGIASLMATAAYISINLGIVNLLPLPALDGGRVIFVLIEMVMGRPLNREKEAIIHTIGFALLMMLTLYLVFKDVINIAINNG